MSIGGCTSANSSGAMDVLTDSHTPTSDLAGSTGPAHVTTVKSTSREEDCGPVSEGSDLAVTRATGAGHIKSTSHERDCEKISEGSDSRSTSTAHVTTAKSTSHERDCERVSEGSGCEEKDTPVHVESLRWDRRCSDEGEEKHRIEIYKENRRKRYEKALEERKARLSLCTTNNKVKYYVI